jgi:hypothetical protein
MFFIPPSIMGGSRNVNLSEVRAMPFGVAARTWRQLFMGLFFFSCSQTILKERVVMKFCIGRKLTQILGFHF